VVLKNSQPRNQPLHRRCSLPQAANSSITGNCVRPTTIGMVPLASGKNAATDGRNKAFSGLLRYQLDALRGAIHFEADVLDRDLAAGLVVNLAANFEPSHPEVGRVAPVLHGCI
jgi:hypothetical protein